VDRLLSKTAALIGVAKKMKHFKDKLSKELNAMPSGKEDIIAREKSVASLQQEIRRLELVSQKIENDDYVSNKELGLSSDELPSFEAVDMSIGGIKSFFGSIKKDLIDSKKQDNLSNIELEKAINFGKTKAEEDDLKEIKSAELDSNYKSLVSDEKGKEIQAAIYAAVILRSFGYFDLNLEFDAMLSCLLSEYLEEQIAGKFSQEILDIHKSLHASSLDIDMLKKDISQAVRMARSYNSSVGVITGKVRIDPGLFSEYCDKIYAEFESDFDYILVERARSFHKKGGLSLADCEQIFS
jgi:hypothetical protein